METQIFENYEAFLKRKKRHLNGVSPEFAAANPNYIEQNYTNTSCWNCKNCRACYCCNNCSDCIAVYYSVDCIDCYQTSHCANCSLIIASSNLMGCNTYYKNADATHFIDKLPTVPNIHKQVFENASQPNALNMELYVTKKSLSFDRAGWVLHVAGKTYFEEALESSRNELFILYAKLIYNKSSNINVPLHQFFNYDHQDALMDMHQCAMAEKEI